MTLELLSTYVIGFTLGLVIVSPSFIRVMNVWLVCGSGGGNGVCFVFLSFPLFSGFAMKLSADDSSLWQCSSPLCW